MMDLDISGFENSVDLDQLASEKPADLDLHCFTLSLKRHANYVHVLESCILSLKNGKNSVLFF